MTAKGGRAFSLRENGTGLSPDESRENGNLSRSL